MVYTSGFSRGPRYVFHPLRSYHTKAFILPIYNSLLFPPTCLRVPNIEDGMTGLNGMDAVLGLSFSRGNEESGVA